MSSWRVVLFYYFQLVIYSNSPYPHYPFPLAFLPFISEKEGKVDGNHHLQPLPSNRNPSERTKRNALYPPRVAHKRRRQQNTAGPANVFKMSRGTAKGDKLNILPQFALVLFRRVRAENSWLAGWLGVGLALLLCRTHTHTHTLKLILIHST